MTGNKKPEDIEDNLNDFLSDCEPFYDAIKGSMVSSGIKEEVVEETLSKEVDGETYDVYSFKWDCGRPEFSIVRDTEDFTWKSKCIYTPHLEKLNVYLEDYDEDIGEEDYRNELEKHTETAKTILEEDYDIPVETTHTSLENCDGFYKFS